MMPVTKSGLPVKSIVMGVENMFQILNVIKTSTYLILSLLMSHSSSSLSLSFLLLSSSFVKLISDFVAWCLFS